MELIAQNKRLSQKKPLFIKIPPYLPTRTPFQGEGFPSLVKRGEGDFLFVSVLGKLKGGKKDG